MAQFCRMETIQQRPLLSTKDVKHCHLNGDKQIRNALKLQSCNNVHVTYNTAQTIWLKSRNIAFAITSIAKCQHRLPVSE